MTTETKSDDDYRRLMAHLEFWDRLSEIIVQSWLRLGLGVSSTLQPQEPSQ